MELIIYLLGVLLIPLLILFKAFKIKKNNLAQFNFEDKSFANVGELRFLAKKIHTVLYLSFVLMISSTMKDFESVYIKMLLSITGVILIFRNIGSQNDTH